MAIKLTKKSQAMAQGIIGSGGSFNAKSTMEYGETTCVGFGCNPVLGLTSNEILLHFDKDDDTKAVVLEGEIGEVHVERAARIVKK